AAHVRTDGRALPTSRSAAAAGALRSGSSGGTMMKPLPGAPPEVRIARREAKAMLAAGGWLPDPELSKVIGLECFQSDRGQAMILMPGKRSGANLCEDRAALLRYSLAERARPPEHMLEGLFPCGESFPAEISKLIDQLAVDTGIARSDLDGT